MKIVEYDVVKYKAVLHSVTPIYIGSHETERPIVNFAIVKRNNQPKVVAIKEQKVLEYLNRYYKNEKAFKEKLSGFLSLKDVEVLAKDVRYFLHLPSNDVRNLRNNARSIRPIIRDPYSRPYIPGSSLKGAIRTALLYHFMKQNPSMVERLNREIEQYIDTMKKKKKRIPRDLSRKMQIDRRNLIDFIEGSFLRSELNAKGKASKQHTDILRTLRITDSKLLPRDACTLYEVKVYRTVKTQLPPKLEPKGFSIFLEAIPPNTKIEFEITIDRWLLKKFKKTFDLEDILLESLREFSAKIIEEDKWIKLPNLHKPSSQDVNIRIGFGSGLIATSLFSLLDSNLRKIIRDIMKGHFDDEYIPSSRKVVLLNDHPKWLLGWGKLELERVV